MTTVTLRPVTKATFRECIALSVADSQKPFVADNVYSLAQAAVNPLLTPLAIYDGSLIACDLSPDDRMVGFVMYQVMGNVGFIMRLMVDKSHQRRGYGRAATRSIVRRLQLTPGLEFIATSVHRDNPAAESLYRSLGFVDNPAMEDPIEVYLKLPWDPLA